MPEVGPAKATAGRPEGRWRRVIAGSSHDTLEAMSMRRAICAIQRRCSSGLLLALFLLMQSMPLFAMWSGPSLKGMECCRRSASGHSCCKRQSMGTVIKPTNVCSGSSCCVSPSISVSVRFAMAMPPIVALPVAVVLHPVDAPEPRTAPTPGYSPIRFQRPPPVA